MSFCKCYIYGYAGGDWQVTEAAKKLTKLQRWAAPAAWPKKQLEYLPGANYHLYLKNIFYKKTAWM